MRAQRKSGFILSYLQIFVSSAVGLLFTPFMISRLGQTEYGLYQLLYATIGYIALLDFGLGGTLTRYILKYRADNDEKRVASVITMCVKIYSAVALIAFLLVIVVAWKLDAFFPASITAENLGYARKLFLGLGLTTCVSLLSHALMGVETAYEQYLVTKGARLLQQLFRVAILLVLLLMGMKAMALVIVDLCLIVALAVFDVLFCRFSLHVNILGGKWEQALFRSLVNFSVFVFLQIIVTQINNSLDRIILGRYQSLQMVALYAVVMQIYNLYNSFGGVIPGISLPQISNKVFSGASDKEVTLYCARFSRYQFVLLMPLLGGFMLFGQQFASCWVPDYDAYNVWTLALLIVTPQILEFIENPIFHVMKAKNLQAVRSLALIAVAVFNVIFSVILIRFFPTYGCALGTFISFILGNNIFCNIYYHKRVGIIIPLYFKSLLQGLLPAWVLSMLIGLPVYFIPGTGWTSLILKCALYAVGYVVTLYFVGLNTTEKEQIDKLKNKVLHRA